MNAYLKKYGFQSPKLINEPDSNLGIIIVIPCYNETKVVETLESLNRCSSTRNTVKTILVVNQSEVTLPEIKAQNLKTWEEVESWRVSNPKFDLDILFEKSLPKKHAGVGLARKIGMDEAVNLFSKIDKDGVIVALDSDCLVEVNYLQAIEKHFEKHPKTPGCSIRYNHPLEGEKYSPKIYEGIAKYELHLRYYNQALRICEFHFAFHTVGSSMAVKNSAYQKQGGMNKRKAGEDFYFLQKIIELGGFTELNSTCVIPSPRISDRVPFGTGKAIGDWIGEKKETFFTYNFNSFLELKKLTKNLSNFYKSKDYQIDSVVLNEFFKEINFKNKIEEIKQNTTNYPNFEKRFYRFFNAFMVLKFVHFSRDNFLPNLPIEKESIKLLEYKQLTEIHGKHIRNLLGIYREIES